MTDNSSEAALPKDRPQIFRWGAWLTIAYVLAMGLYALST
jgi:hypothetical protein